MESNFDEKKTSLSDILTRSSSMNLTDAGGCTANVALVKDGVIYVANAGDSRAVAFTKDKKTHPLSFDHKPENTEERTRINNAGGYVEENRVNGNLNLSRALGDFTYKSN